MENLSSPQAYVFNLYTTSSAEATRLWRRKIKERWDYRCAYCGSTENITIDHVLARSKGGKDTTKNMVSCCHSCNQSKAHTPWEEWYFSQEFFSFQKHDEIMNWMKPDPPVNLFSYKRNNAT